MNKLVNRIKAIYSNIRIANIKPTGVLATRMLIGVILIPIMLVITQYILVFIKGDVSTEAGKIIDVGIKIIDHIFIPSVLTAIVGFLALWLDENHNGVPDKLEKDDKK